MNEDAIDRKLVCAFIDGLISDDVERKKALEYINELPPVNPQEPKTDGDAISRDMALEKMADYVSSGYADSVNDFEAYSKIICELPSVTPQPCEDAISRQAVLELAEWFDLNPQHFSVANLIDEVENIPSVTPQEPKTGHWIGVNGDPSHLQDGMTTESVWCSVCGKWLTASDEYSCDGKYCPNCGAKMEVEE